MKTDEDYISNSAHVKVARVPQKAKRPDVALAQHSLLEPVIDAAISFARHHNSRRDRLAGCFLALTEKPSKDPGWSVLGLAGCRVR